MKSRPTFFFFGLHSVSTSIITTSASQTTTGDKHSKGTFIHSLFEGTLTSETRCLTCETVGDVILFSLPFGLPRVILGLLKG